MSSNGLYYVQRSHSLYPKMATMTTRKGNIRKKERYKT